MIKVDREILAILHIYKQLIFNQLVLFYVND